MNPRIVIIINCQGIETIRIVASSPEEESKGETLLAKIQNELKEIDEKVKCCIREEDG